MTLSAIAREFECTPSAISYIVRKAEASGGQEEEAAGSEPSLPLDAPAAEPAPAAEAPKAAAPRTDAPKRDSHRAPKGDAPRDAGRTAAPADSAADAAPAPVVHTSHGETLKLSRPEAGPPVSQAPAQTAPAQPAPAQPAPSQTAADAPAAKAASATAPAAAPAGLRADPGTPVDAVEARLRETAKACLGAYRTWRQQPGEGSIQTLSDAVHELRKALARIEIDMSASRKEEQAIRPIPIPAHRAARRHQ